MIYQSTLGGGVVVPLPPSARGVAASRPGGVPAPLIEEVPRSGGGSFKREPLKAITGGVP